jgi:hypothetical protein
LGLHPIVWISPALSGLPGRACTPSLLPARIVLGLMSMRANLAMLAHLVLLHGREYRTAIE